MDNNIPSMTVVAVSTTSPPSTPTDPPIKRFKFNNFLLIPGLIFVIFLAVSGSYFLGKSSNPTVPLLSPTDVQQKTCTSEAKICPDGSSLVRTGPNCEFTPCPTISNTKITLSPQKQTPDIPSCNPHQLQLVVQLLPATTEETVQQMIIALNIKNVNKGMSKRNENKSEIKFKITNQGEFDVRKFPGEKFADYYNKHKDILKTYVVQYVDYLSSPDGYLILTFNNILSQSQINQVQAEIEKELDIILIPSTTEEMNSQLQTELIMIWQNDGESEQKEINSLRDKIIQYPGLFIKKIDIEKGEVCLD